MAAERKYRSIDRRLAAYLIAAGAICTLFLTAFSAYQEYRLAKEQQSIALKQIESLVVRNLTEAIWQYDTEQIQQILAGVLEVQDVVAASVVDANHNTLATLSKSETDVRNSPYRRFAQSYSLVGKKSEVYLTFGTLEVIATDFFLLKGIWNKLAFIFFSHGLNTVAITILMILIFRTVVTRHISRLTKHLADVELSSGAQIVPYDAPKHAYDDELSVLADTFNAMAKAVNKFHADEAQSHQGILRACAEVRRIYLESSGEPSTIYQKIIAEFMALTKSELGFIGEKYEPQNHRLKLHVIHNEADKSNAFCSFVDTKTATPHSLSVIITEGIRSGLPFQINEIDTKVIWDLDIPVVPRSYMAIPIKHHDETLAIVGIANRADAYGHEVLEYLQPLIDAVANVVAMVNADAKTKRLANVVNHSGAAIATLDGMITFTSWNKAASDLLGYRFADIYGTPLEKIVAPDKATAVREALQNALHGRPAQLESVLVAKDTKTIPVDLIMSPVGAESDQSVSLLIMDLREKKTMEEHLLHTSKLASIGKLAAGIGHEINNPLMILIGYVSKIARRLGEIDVKDPAIHTAIERHEVAAQRIAAIVNGLRTFSRADGDTFSPFDLSALIHESLSLITEIYEQMGVTVKYTQAPGKVCVNGNRGRVQQVLMNIVANAKDAALLGRERFIKVELVQEGTQATCRITDSGTGIPAAVQSRIFDPFFTTKEVGKGTGIGLSIAHVIMKEHSGQISFVTSPEGTTFSLTFPVLEASAVTDLNPKRDAVHQPAPTRSNLRVLVVDDESEIISIIRDFFELDLGCHVDSASNGFEALEKFKKNVYDILFTDIQMPGLDGVSLARRVREMTLPTPPYIVASTGGVGNQFDYAGTGETPIDRVLSKPFKSVDFATIVHHVDAQKRSR